MYEKAIVAMAKQSVTLEVLSYHASASADDAIRLMVTTTMSKFLLIFINQFYKFFKNAEPKNTLVSIFSTPRLCIR
jgi:hypothetical protein